MTEDRPAATPAPGPGPALVAAYLASRDAPCPGCGYNLRGLTGSACPECGKPLELRLVGATEPEHEERAIRIALAWPLMLGIMAILGQLFSAVAIHLAPPTAFGLHASLSLAESLTVVMLGVSAFFAMATLRKQRGTVWTPSRRRAWVAIAFVMLYISAFIHSKIWLLALFF